MISAGEVDPINPAVVWSFPHYNAFASRTSTPGSRRDITLALAVH
jgi:hypothetical protein